ncbi:hypothetical protein GWN42_25740, partial [candidate division KSB1 bacterium]|nr:hypothetical protein [candidate division KSB1 bacterium]NIS28080.1 hypothetical protein [candidate division KSB1 bacterium]NIU28601.1 hypothetical protein [candidate division KSB1 bacterium]NIU93407.1 hypothetical protein [candidate division KSB1 bacterium]NIV96096.1 hypothetical protein [candidate division KSB1 bacterium]
MNAKRSLVLLMVTIAIFLLNARATPCTCKPPVPPTQELERSDAVFAGKVVNIKLDSVENGRQIHRVQFLVDRYWKGFSDDTITVNTDKPTGANCGFYFDPDSSYLVY